MTDYINEIIKTNLFENIDKKEISNILENFKSQKKSYEKGNIIIDRGDKVESIYIKRKNRNIERIRRHEKKHCQYI